MSLNFRKKVIKIFFVLLFLTAIWITTEYYFASEEYEGYYNILNVTIPRPDVASKLYKFLAGRFNISVEFANELQEKGFFSGYFKDFEEADHIFTSGINITFDSIFTELRHITPSTLNTFFIESRCATEEMTKRNNITNNFILSARQCCSVESAARTNPERHIYILHTCPLSDDFLLRAPKYVRRLLLNYFNVHVVRYNMTEVFAGTPVQELLLNSKKVDDSRFPIEHLSDILRLTMLWKFGGFYCDLDVITVRPVAQLGTNFCGLEKSDLIGNAILHFEPSGYGHYVLSKTLQRLNKNFNGAQWTANGPDLVTKMILQECNMTVVKHLLYCPHFKVYQQDILYPLQWVDYPKVFKNGLGKKILKNLKKTGFTIHLWNKYSHEYSVQVGSSQAYSLLAEEFCHDVYSSCGDNF